jgi:hypothetical protein
VSIEPTERLEITYFSITPEFSITTTASIAYALYRHNLIEISPRKISILFLILIPTFITLTYIFRNQIFSFFQLYLTSGALAISIIGIIELALYFLMLAIYAPYKTATPADIREDVRLYAESKSRLKKSKASIPNPTGESSMDTPGKSPLNKSLEELKLDAEKTESHNLELGIKRYYMNVVIEYELVRKIILIAVPLFIILTTLSFVEPKVRLSFGVLMDIPLFKNGGTESELLYALLSGLWAGLFFTVSGGLLRMLFWLGRKSFRYNFAKGSAIFCRENQESHAKLEYLMLSLNSYNRFLQRILKLKINELALSKIVKSTLNEYRKIDTVSSYFDSEDTLYPATQLNSPELVPTNDEFLVKGKTERSDIIKEWGAVSAALIPLAITVIKELFYP